MSSKKITLPKRTDCELLFDSNRGIHNLRNVWDLAKQYGMKGRWDKNDECECAIEAENWLNQNVCVGCSIQCHDDVWIVRDGYDFENGCEYQDDDNEDKEREGDELWAAQPSEYDL